MGIILVIIFYFLISAHAYFNYCLIYQAKLTDCFMHGDRAPSQCLYEPDSELAVQVSADKGVKHSSTNRTQ